MKLKNLKEYQLNDVVKFNQELNPVLWEKDESLRPEVRDTLIKIAEDFQEFLGVNGYELDDITISGSNAGYTYTENSDIDLHLIVDMTKSEKSTIYRELFDAKKYQYNDLHDYRIDPHEVELYVQDANQEHISQGIYSVLNDEWISVPTRRQIEIDDMSVSSKFEDVKNRIEAAIKSDDLDHMNRIAKKIGEMRRSGLSKTGEFGPENLSFKILRNTGWLEKLKDARNDAKDKKLSIQEETNKKNTEKNIKDFVNFCIDWLDLDNAPEVNTVYDKKWSADKRTFGQFNAREGKITVNISGRHPVDAMRTIAHELVHYAQSEKESLPPGAGETGSRWENDANATAGQIMRDYVDVNPSAFSEDIKEASGYIPKNSKEANDPRFSHGLTVDIRPGEIERQAKKLGLTTDSSEIPMLLGRKNKKTVKESTESFFDEDLLEVAMNPTALQRWAETEGSDGIRAGFEAEIIMPDTESAERDYRIDKIPKDLDEVLNFFDLSDTGFIELEDVIVGNFLTWAEKKFKEKKNKSPEDDELMDFVEEEVSYGQWFEEEQIFLSTIADDYDHLVNWPQYIGGNDDLESLADEIQDVVKKSVYFGSSNADDNTYVIVDDESINPESSSDTGLEIISPPLPLQEMMNDFKNLKEFLNQKKAKTNRSTGLHINISLPESRKVDYVKLVLFSGDDYVLEQFNRRFNQYAKNALKTIESNVKSRKTGIFDPTDLFNTLKEGSIELASRILQQDVGEEKYTSIHLKQGYIEFRSPGGDWLNKDVNTLTNTTLRYARAMTIAGDPEFEKKEYLKKLYKLIDTKNPVQSLFVQYASGEIGKKDLLRMWSNKVLNSDKFTTVGQGETIDYFNVSNGKKSVVVRAKTAQDAEEWVTIVTGDFEFGDKLTTTKLASDEIPEKLKLQKRKDDLAKRIRQEVTIFLFVLEQPDGKYNLYVTEDSEEKARKRAANHPMVQTSENAQKMTLEKIISGRSVTNIEEYDFDIRRKTIKTKLKISFEDDQKNKKEVITPPFEFRTGGHTNKPKLRKEIHDVALPKIKSKYGENAQIEEIDFATSMGNFNILEEQSQKSYQPLKESLTHIDQSNSGGDLEAYVVNTSAPNMSNYLESQGVDQSIIQNLIKSYNTVGIIRNMHVDDEKRGKGHGSDLMNKAIESAYNNEAEAVILISDTAESNEFDLTDWYKNYGFEVIGNASGGDLLMILDEG